MFNLWQQQNLEIYTRRIVHAEYINILDQLVENIIVVINYILIVYKNFKINLLDISNLKYK